MKIMGDQTTSSTRIRVQLDNLFSRIVKANFVCGLFREQIASVILNTMGARGSRRNLSQMPLISDTAWEDAYK
jgi:hypothetical protein